MSELKSNGNTGRTAFFGTLAALALAFGAAGCNFGGDHQTPHAPVNPAMSGAPSESDHTNTDRDDLQGGYGSGSAQGAQQDDNAPGGLNAQQAAAPADSAAAH